MRKRYFNLALAALLFAGCSSDEYVGETYTTDSAGTSETDEITFSGTNSNLSRATTYENENAAVILNYSFNVLGTKCEGNNYTNVFALTPYNSEGITSANTYQVWYENSAWDYVGTSGESYGTENYQVKLNGDQVTKYWDYSASSYDFIAYANLGEGTISNVTTSGFSFSGDYDNLGKLYVSEKTNLTGSSNYTNPVTFTFHSLVPMVRLGIYETLEGWKVTNVTFHYNSTTDANNAYLSGTFPSTSTSSYLISYDDSGKPQVSDASTSTSANYMSFGTFSATGGLGTSSTSPTWAGGSSSSYTGVMTTSGAVATLYVDYTITSEDGSGETITVYDAQATIPAEYMKWQSGYAYTYLFKISEETNGSTLDGNSFDTYAGLTAITLAAVVEKNEETGVISTVTTPTIITYQQGSTSLTDGIKYTASSNPIYITVNTAGTVQSLTIESADSFESGDIALYTTSDSNVTEYALENGTVTLSAATLSAVDTGNETVDGITFTYGSAVKFTPSGAGTYVVKYYNGTAFTYKVITVVSGS